MSEAVIRRLLRALALSIGVAAVIDPGVTSDRTVKPLVLVSAIDSTRDGRLADAVSKAIAGRFTVARSPVAGASAAIFVGDRLPEANDELSTPTYVVLGDKRSPSVSIEAMSVPPSVPMDARVPVVVRIALRGASNRSLDVALRAGGLVAEHVTRRVASTDTALTLRLSFIPTTVGATRLRVSATLGGVERAAVADAVVDARERRWPVLFFDPRPSWTSTFVRRAIERDPRFFVTSRIVTSRGVGSNAGRPPPSLADPATLSSFDAIVIGAPDALSASDVAGLDAFMRRRGGTVVLLLEGRTPGPYDRLTGVTTWSSNRAAAATFTASRADSATLRVTEIVSPGTLPIGAAAIAGDSRPVVWESAVGAGRLVVSGAVDAWRFRDPTVSGFVGFWQSIIADAATSAPPSVSVSATPKTTSFSGLRMTTGAVATPGEPLAVSAVVRDAALQTLGTAGSVLASIGAVIEPGTTPARLWPDAEPGQFTGVIRAPRAPGLYRLVVAGADGSASTPILVATDVQRVAGTSRSLLDAWAKSRGGRVFHASEMGELSAALRTAVQPPSRPVIWHPFRSPWWIVPFALAVSGEWWLRRRRGLR